MTLMLLKLAALMLGLLALAALLGAGPASYLSVPRRARLALAPVFGVCVAMCVLTSAIWFVPGNVAGWLILPTIALSGWWVWRRRSSYLGASRGTVARALAELGMIVVFVIGAFGFAPASQGSLGPSSHDVWDGINYAGLETALQYSPVLQDPATDPWGPPWQITARTGEMFGADSYQQIGFDGVAASLDSVLGIEPGRTQVPFMFALVLIGALGSYGVAAATFGRKWRPAALIAGLLYAGPAYLQLTMEGSQAAISGIALMLPSTYLAWGWIAGGRRPELLLFGLLAAGMQAAYPILFPGYAAAVGMMLVAYLAHYAWLRRRSEEPPAQPTRAVVRRLAGSSVIAAVLTAVLVAPAFARNLTYWWVLLVGSRPTDGLPVYDLPLPVIPGWLLGTRPFYELSHTSDASVAQWLMADVAPLALLALIVFAAIKRRSLIPFVVLAAMTLLVALQVNASGCSYCVQRSLLPFPALLTLAIAAGVTTIALSHVRWAKTVAVGLVLLTFGAVFHAQFRLEKRAAYGSYWFPDAFHSLLNRVAPQSGPVLIEGFDGTEDAGSEMASVLHSLRSGNDVRTSLLHEDDEYSAFAYLGAAPTESIFTPDYRTIVTRFTEVATDRETLETVRGAALQRRVTPFDVTVSAGIQVNRPQAADHRAYVVGPLLFTVVGPPAETAMLNLDFTALPRQSTRGLPKGTEIRERGAITRVCVPVGKGATRMLELPLTPAAPQSAPAAWWANRSMLVGGTVLDAMRVAPNCAAN